MKIQTRVVCIRGSYQNLSKMQCRLMSERFQNFYGKTLISRDPLLPSIAHFPKMGRFPMI